MTCHNVLNLPRHTGPVSPHTLERWALVREIAELEEILADNYRDSELIAQNAWICSARIALAAKRAALQHL